MKWRFQARLRLVKRALKLFLTRKISTRLIFTYVALGAIPLITISIFLISLSESTVQTYIHQRNLETARRASNEIYLFLKSPLTILQITSVTDDITRMDRFSQSRLINKIKEENSIFRKIFVLDEEGLVVSTTSFGEEMRDYSGEEFFRTSTNGQEFISDVYFTPSRFPVLLIAEPIKIYNETIGVLAAEVDLKSIWDLVDNINIGKTGYAFLLSARGVVIAHRDKEKVLEKVNYAGYKFFQAIRKGQQGIVNLRLDDEDVIAAYAPIDPLNWGIVVRQTEREAFTLARQMQERVYIFITVTIIIALVLGFLSVRRFTKPLGHLVKGAREYATGHLQHRINIERKDELAELAQEFNSMAESLLKYQTDLKRMTRLAALSRFASLVSHEIRNPLNSMNINMQLLKRLIYRDDVSPERKAKYLEIISSEITRINDLVNNFLAIARPPELNLVQTNVHKILDDVVSIQNAHAVSEGIKIRRNYVDGDVYGMYDYNQLKQVFHNVIINAIDSMPEGGELNISTRIINKNDRKGEENIFISLQFSDTGIGINQDFIKDVFEFYFTTKPTGSGLGLAIAKQIVEGHNGQISLDSKEGSGTTVFIELPVKEYRLRKPDSMVEEEQQNNN